MTALAAFFATLTAAFVFGTFWFWVSLIIFTLFLIGFVENEHGGKATFTLILSLLFLNFIAKLGIIFFVLHNPLKTVELLAAYLAVGVVWGVVKWSLYVHNQLDRYNEFKDKFLRENDAKELTPQLSREMQKTLRSQASYDSNRVIVNPQVSEHKSTIILWMSYWPFSATWTLVNDPVRKLYQFVYSRLRGSLQAISDRMFKGAAADLALGVESNLVTADEVRTKLK
jgi:hypothetical protein